jgi:hypothetical protein
MVLKNVVDLVDALIQNLANVLCEVRQLQKLCELYFDDQSLQQEHDALDVEYISVVGHRARLVIYDHVELKHLGVITRELCKSLRLPLLSLLLGLLF